MNINDTNKNTGIPYLGLPWWLRWYKSACNAGGSGFDPWLGKIPWRREWLPTPVFLPGELDRQRGLVGCSPWSHKSITTEQLTLSFFSYLILLCFTDTELFLFFNQLKVSGNPPLIKSQGIIFSAAFTSLHLCVTCWQFLQYFKLSSYISCGHLLWWSVKPPVVFEVTIVIVLGAPWTLTV